MATALVVTILAAIVYTSALSSALRMYTRAGLTARLSEERQRRWLHRLDSHERRLQLASGVARMAAMLALVVFVYHEHLSHIERAPTWNDFVMPTVTLLGLLLACGVAVPNAIAAHAGDAFLAANLRLAWLLYLALYPVERILWFLDVVVRRLIGTPEATTEEQAARIEQEILTAVSEGEAHGAVDEDQKEMIQSVIELNETTVSAIMTPRTDIVGVPATATYDDVRDVIVRNGHSRVPVYDKTIDHIIGVLYAKDMLRLRPGEPFDARKVMRAAPYVPLTKTLGELLDEFRQTKVQIAIVLDEYGGTAGLATIEDILEELVGEIDDEYDQPEAPVLTRIDADTVELDSRVPIYQVNQELGLDLPEDAEFETIGGYVFSTLGRIPAAGEEFRVENLHFRILDAEARRINRLRVRVQREPAAT